MPITKHNSFPDLIIAGRTELELTQVQLANELGVSDSYISILERGTIPPSKVFVTKLVEFYNTSFFEVDEWEAHVLADALRTKVSIDHLNSRQRFLISALASCDELTKADVARLTTMLEGIINEQRNGSGLT